MTVNVSTIISPAFTSTTKKVIEYPETDGQPMAETDFQREPLTYCVEALGIHFADNPDIYVSGNLLVYYEKGNPKKSFAPDVFVVLNIPNHKRKIYKLWEEGKAPDLIIEILSEKTWKNDTGKKKVLYGQLGVKEYFLYDPLDSFLDKPLMGYWLDKDGEYQPMALDEQSDWIGLRSHLLHIELRIEGGQLRLYNPETKQYLNRLGEERQARLEAETETEQVKNQMKQTVLNMLDEGLPIEVVSRLTTLSVAEIEGLKK